MPASCPCGAPALEDGLCGFCLEHSPKTVRELLRRQRDRIGELRHGLDESVKLQAHYAELLNMHDGGERRAFKDADEWLRRLGERGA